MTGIFFSLHHTILFDTALLVISLTTDPSHYTVNACLQPICTLHGAAVVTVEGIGSTKTKLHPVQVAPTIRLYRVL